MTATRETIAVPSVHTGTEFSRYVQSQALLSLQNFRTTAPGEPCFLIITQTMELLFNLAYIEARTARDSFAGHDVDAALAALRRLRAAQRVMHEGWEVLSTLSPVDYLLFRDELGDGSGFQSFAYRQWEFILGKKDSKLIVPYLDDPIAGPRMRKALDEPGLYDVVLQQFVRYGIDLPVDCLVRDWTQSSQNRPEVEAAWRRVYEDPSRFVGLHRIAEDLINVAYEFARWQATHVLVVERVLGAKRGTAGTSGVEWLRRAGQYRVFGELWTVRGEL